MSGTAGLNRSSSSSAPSRADSAVDMAGDPGFEPGARAKPAGTDAKPAARPLTGQALKNRISQSGTASYESVEGFDKRFDPMSPDYKKGQKRALEVLLAKDFDGSERPQKTASELKIPRKVDKKLFSGKDEKIDFGRRLTQDQVDAKLDDPFVHSRERDRYKLGNDIFRQNAEFKSRKKGAGAESRDGANEHAAAAFKSLDDLSKSVPTPKRRFAIGGLAAIGSTAGLYKLAQKLKTDRAKAPAGAGGANREKVKKGLKVTGMVTGGLLALGAAVFGAGKLAQVRNKAA